MSINVWEHFELEKLKTAVTAENRQNEMHMEFIRVTRLTVANHIQTNDVVEPQ